MFQAEKIKTYIMCSIMFFQKNRTVYDIMWKNMVKPGRPEMTVLYGTWSLHAG